jgi:hypothetical protein
MAKYGSFYVVMGSGSTFLAPVTAVPTTALTMALYLPEDAKGRRLRIKGVDYFLASGTPTASSGLMVCVTAIQQARPTLSTGDNSGYAGTVISELGGGGKPGNTKALFINAITLTGPQPAWTLVGANPSGVGLASATLIGHGGAFDVSNRGFKVRPGHMLGVTVLSGTGTTPLFGFGVAFDDEDDGGD